MSHKMLVLLIMLAILAGLGPDRQIRDAGGMALSPDLEIRPARIGVEPA